MIVFNKWKSGGKLCQKCLMMVTITTVFGLAASGTFAVQEPSSGKRDDLSNSPRKIEIWNGKIPGLSPNEKAEIISKQDERIGERVTKVTRPMISIYSPPAEKNTGAAVVICPGGGFHILAYDLEGTEVARWLNQLGVTGIVLHYRVPTAQLQPKYRLPLMDLQRAIRLVRSRSEEFGIDPRRVGVLGFSAGGKLAAVASTSYRKSEYPVADPADSLSCRPDFTILVYPAYLNRDGRPQLKKEFSVDSETPPAVLIHTSDDRVSSLGSIAYYAALKQAGVPAALHVFPQGGHGYGLRPSQNAVSAWPKLVASFLSSQKILRTDPNSTPSK